MNLEVEKEDIKRIGHTIYGEDGKTAFICNGNSYNIEMILLRNILKCFGDYKIISEEDYDGYEDNDILVITNLPYEMYMSL
jgi:hypothetical protein